MSKGQLPHLQPLQPVLQDIGQANSFKKQIFKLYMEELIPKLQFLTNLFLENSMYPVAGQKVIPVFYSSVVPVQSLSFVFRNTSVQVDFVALETEQCIKVFAYIHNPGLDIETTKLFSPQSFNAQCVEDFIEDCICRVKHAVK